MNERIRELMRGAIADALMQNDRDGDMDKMYIPLLFAENFAELLIRECVNLAVKEEERYDSLSSVHAAYCSMSMTNFQEVLKKHFGVDQ